MKSGIARGLFLVMALAVTTAAVAAWEQPRPSILSADHGQGSCAMPRALKAQAASRPDQDLLLFMFSLGQGMRAKL
jgi:hypothetical protein